MYTKSANFFLKLQMNAYIHPYKGKKQNYLHLFLASEST